MSDAKTCDECDGRGTICAPHEGIPHVASSDEGCLCPTCHGSGVEEANHTFHQIGGDDQEGGTLMPLDNITMTEGSFITHEPDEWYPGLLVRVEEGGDYGFGDTIRFVIQLDGEDDQETWALASQKLSPRSKLYGWVKGIDATLIPDVGEPFKYKALENRRVEVMFETGEEREKVVKIRAEKKTSTLQKGQKAAAAAKKPQDDDSPF